jgi:hypothetical protein
MRDLIKTSKLKNTHGKNENEHDRDECEKEMNYNV